ncbi:DUF6442 family protein [Aerococcus urinae]|uniref:DUF6442 family protein n=1 Tax=Aerococcus urinae TaxID=1376 RepID=A0A0X8FES4_9LACT|nr:DUF6442 family protein [Aerococcus urinae]AMB95952.1 hypothetical protein AWM73_05265 [Aerococcus urinae]MCY3032540.1 DUF6442 family protein [Aerococcus urinae]MCY3038498.1 DUF6442 family protein [Aerococcus urinae]MCY3044586.1 DUF6442 family protein [Aerococcus urinae]MCY3047004.1 DUF6442 family protein [Aerococcus urinae]
MKEEEKERILAKYRSDNQDEYQQHLIKKADDYGFAAMCVVAIILMAIKAINGQSIADIEVILFTFISVNFYKRYKISQEKSALILLIFTSVLNIAFFLRFIHFSFGAA